MLCVECGANANKGYTTDVIKRLEEIVERAKKMMQEIVIIDYEKAA